MASVRARRGKLFIDFTYDICCRETTNFPDTPANVKKLALVAKKMEQTNNPRYLRLWRLLPQE